MPTFTPPRLALLSLLIPFLGSALLAIPNYARNNRGGRSIVWLREK